MGEPEGDPGFRQRPKQSRSHQTYRSILEAAAELFADRGYEQTTTHQVAVKAGVSVGALYRYFSDKESILLEIYKQECQCLRDRILGEFSLADLIQKDIPELVRRIIALAFKIYSERPGLRRVLSQQSRQIESLAELRRAQEEEVHKAVREIFKAAPEVRIPDVEVGAYLTSLFIESLIEDTVLHRSGELEFDEQRILEGAVDFILSYVQRKPGG